MNGQYKNGKIIYHTPIVHHLYGGSWETGWSGVGRSNAQDIEYDVLEVNKLELIEGEYYDFGLIDDSKGRKIAFIKNK